MNPPHTTDASLIATAQAFAQEQLAPAFQTASPADAALNPLRAHAATLGLTGIQVPASCGGSGMAFATRASVCRALAGVDFGFAMSVVNTHNVAHKVALLSDVQTRAQVLPGLLAQGETACTALTEPGAGSDFAAIQTGAEWHQDHWEISGEKSWIINARHARWAIVYAQCGATGDRQGIAAFLVDCHAEGCERYAIDSAVSQSSIGTGGIRLNRVRIAPERVLVPAGAAFKEILAEINSARTYVAAMCLGMLEAAIDTVQTYGRARHTFGRPLHQHQAWRLALAQAQTDCCGVESLLDRAVEAIEQRPASDPAVQRLCAQTKVLATQTAHRHLPALLHALGAHGLDPRYPLARHCAALHMASLTDGSDEMLLERIAALM